MSFKQELPLTGVAKLSPREFTELSALVYKTAGINLTPAKTIMLESRLNKRLRALNISSFKNYIDYVTSKDGMQKELTHMIDVVTTNKTDFFREPHHFEILKDQIVPEFTRTVSGRPMRLWSAACSTGEEPYTMAMVLQACVEQRPSLDYTIFASDLSTEVLQKAQLATYDMGKISGIPMEMRKKFLLKKDDHVKPTVRIIADLRRKVRFQQANLMGSLHDVEAGFDIVFCRNVLIYFDRPTQQSVLSRIIQKIKPQGYLFIGHSESLYQLDLPVVQVRPTVYQKQ